MANLVFVVVNVNAVICGVGLGWLWAGINTGRSLIRQIRKSQKNPPIHPPIELSEPITLEICLIKAHMIPTKCTHLISMKLGHFH